MTLIERICRDFCRAQNGDPDAQVEVRLPDGRAITLPAWRHYTKAASIALQGARDFLAQRNAASSARTLDAELHKGPF